MDFPSFKAKKILHFKGHRPFHVQQHEGMLVEEFAGPGRHDLSAQTIKEFGPDHIFKGGHPFADRGLGKINGICGL